MLSQIDLFLKNIKKKDKEITYLKNIYRIEVGEDAIIPKEYLDEEGHENLIGDSNDNQLNTFEQKINSLNLPSVNDKNAKLKITKLKKMKDNKVLIKHLDLSNFSDRGVKIEPFKNLIDGMKIIKSVENLNLSKNNLDDTYSDLICELFVIENLKRIDLSYNNLSKVTGKKLANAIKNSSKLEYLDLSYNPFNNDDYSCSNICLAVKSHPNLFHFGICDSTRDSAIKFLLFKTDLKSIKLDDCKYKAKTFEYFSKILSDKKFNLSLLSLKYSTIDIFKAASLEKGLKLNKSLIYLNLYSTGLCDLAGSRIISSLDNNKTLIELDIGGNNLGNIFCKTLSKLLKSNSTLQKIDLSKNFKIKDQGFSEILEGLVHNQSIIYLGNLEDTHIKVKIRESVSKVLELNYKFLLEAKSSVVGLNHDESKSKVNDANMNNQFNNSLSSLNTSQKMNFFKSSTDFEGQEKLKRESLDMLDYRMKDDDTEQMVINKFSIKTFADNNRDIFHNDETNIDFFIF